MVETAGGIETQTSGGKLATGGRRAGTVGAVESGQCVKVGRGCLGAGFMGFPSKVIGVLSAVGLLGTSRSVLLPYCFIRFSVLCVNAWCSDVGCLLGDCGLESALRWVVACQMFSATRARGAFTSDCLETVLVRRIVDGEAGGRYT